MLGTFVDEGLVAPAEASRVHEGGYESAYRCHIQPKWAGVDMESITANDIEEWLGLFNQAGAARKAWAVLRAILRLAYRKGVTDNDVTRREIRLPHLRRYGAARARRQTGKTAAQRLLRSRVGSLVIGLRLRGTAPMRVRRH